jgi:hypothetical protein
MRTAILAEKLMAEFRKQIDRLASAAMIVLLLKESAANILRN